VLRQTLAVEEAEHGLGVADVYGQQHQREASTRCRLRR
jgi:hypothetical protein